MDNWPQKRKVSLSVGDSFNRGVTFCIGTLATPIVNKIEPHSAGIFFKIYTEIFYNLNEINYWNYVILNKICAPSQKF